jgi:hypothetical protein
VEISVMIDENAFGLLIGYFGIEDEEYGLEREEFVTKIQEFRRLCRRCLEEQSLGPAVRAFDLGHAFYLELPEDALEADPIQWLRRARERLREGSFESVAVLTYGGRWVEENQVTETPAMREMDGASVQACLPPSEPFRHALDADSATRMTAGDEDVGWGPGLYVETDAIEGLGRKLKNEPTPLEAGGATFFRLGR